MTCVPWRVVLLFFMCLQAWVTAAEYDLPQDLLQALTLGTELPGATNLRDYDEVQRALYLGIPNLRIFINTKLCQGELANKGGKYYRSMPINSWYLSEGRIGILGVFFSQITPTGVELNNFFMWKHDGLARLATTTFNRFEGNFTENTELDCEYGKGARVFFTHDTGEDIQELNTLDQVNEALQSGEDVRMVTASNKCENATRRNDTVTQGHGFRLKDWTMVPDSIDPNKILDFNAFSDIYTVKELDGVDDILRSQYYLQLVTKDAHTGVDVHDAARLKFVFAIHHFDSPKSTPMGRFTNLMDTCLTGKSSKFFTRKNVPVRKFWNFQDTLNALLNGEKLRIHFNNIQCGEERIHFYRGRTLSSWYYFKDDATESINFEFLNMEADLGREKWRTEVYEIQSDGQVNLTIIYHNGDNNPDPIRRSFMCHLGEDSAYFTTQDRSRSLLRDSSHSLQTDKPLGVVIHVNQCSGFVLSPYSTAEDTSMDSWTAQGTIIIGGEVNSQKFWPNSNEDLDNVSNYFILEGLNLEAKLQAVVPSGAVHGMARTALRSLLIALDKETGLGRLIYNSFDPRNGISFLGGYVGFNCEMKTAENADDNVVRGLQVFA